MAFWSTETLNEHISLLIKPYRRECITHCAYELSVGAEACISSSDEIKKTVGPDKPIRIPPGQFALLLTEETVSVPLNAIAFISIRASSKLQGLINVSGFHVDPGFTGKLKFSVYNAGSKNIVLDYGQRIFMIWYADLDRTTEDTYSGKSGGANGISSTDIMNTHGEVASPEQLRSELNELKHSLENLKWMAKIAVGLFVALIAALLPLWWNLMFPSPGSDGKDDRTRTIVLTTGGGYPPNSLPAAIASPVTQALPPSVAPSPTVASPAIDNTQGARRPRSGPSPTKHGQQ